MFIVKLSLLCIFAVSTVLAQYDPYEVPHATVEVFRPKGLRVSIPDFEGIRLFAFHGAVNRELNGLEAGDLSRDILKKSNGRWVFEDKRLKLNRGDVINYWLFVIKGNLGYRLDDQKYVVTSFRDAPPDFHTNNGKGPNRHTTTETSYVAGAFMPQSGSDSAVPPPAGCPCRQQPSFTTSSSTPSTMCNLPQQPAASFIPPTTSTQTPPLTTTTRPGTSASDLMIWRELLVNLSAENAEYRDKVVVLQDMNNLLVSKLQKVGDQNLKKLILGGTQLPENDIPKELVLTVLREKLNIFDSRIVKSATRNSDGTITFELSTVEDKVTVLRAAKEKLQNSKFTIKDIDVISIDSSKGDAPVFDVRNQPAN